MLSQYSEIIGKPKLLPYWAHGFFVRSPAFANASVTQEVINKYAEYGFPLQGVSLSEEALNGYYNFNFKDIAKQLSQANPNISMFLPFSYMVAADDPNYG